MEWKWDGQRILAAVDAGTCRLYSRTRQEVSAQYPEIVAAAPSAAVRTEVPVEYFLFDLLGESGQLITSWPYLERRCSATVARFWLAVPYVASSIRSAANPAERHRPHWRLVPMSEGSQIILVNPRQQVLMYLRDEFPHLAFAGMWRCWAACSRMARIQKSVWSARSRKRSASRSIRTR